MKRILIIDDDGAIIAVLADAIKVEMAGVECLGEQKFADAVTRIRSIRPDAVILDLREGALTSNMPGQAVWRAVWEGRFCPIVIYTAGTGELDPPVPAGHPFIKLVQKGKGSEKAVIAHLKEFVPHVEAIDKLHVELEAVVQRVLRDTAGAALVSGANAAHLIHAARRRVAAMMDEATATENRELFSWEQYLVPAIGGSPLTGDLLRRVGGDAKDPSQYRLILSPSCDLVQPRNEPTLLVAVCRGPEAIGKAFSTLPGNAADAAKRVRSQALTQGFCAGFLPLPEFPGVIPMMTACLKDLEVMTYASISTSAQAGAYERVASVDSPFREQVAWAFLSTIARPGMPDRDMQSWADGIVTAIKAKTQAQPAAAVPPPKLPGAN